MYENLAHTLALLSAIVTSSSNAIISRALDGHVTSWNEAATLLFGYEAGEIVGQPYQRLIPPALQPEADRLFSRVVAGERLAAYETVRLHKNGHAIPVAVTASAIRNADGSIIGTSKVVRDISVRKHFETRLKESETRFRTLYQNAPIGIAVLDWPGHFESANSAYCDAVGYAESELRGRHLSALLHPEDRENDLDQCRRLKAGEVDTVELESRYLRR